MTAARAGVGIAALPCVLGDVEPALRRLTPRVIATSRLVVATRRAGQVPSKLLTIACFVSDVVLQNADRLSGLPKAHA